MEYHARQIEILRKACLAAAAADTESSDDLSPLTGHCAAVAYMVQASFGGDIR